MSSFYRPENLISEDDVENKFIQPLMTEVLGYDLNEDLRWKYPVQFQRGHEVVTKQADLVVFDRGKAVLVVEAKRPTESCMDHIEQTDSYAFALEVKYSLTINGRQLILREYLAGNKKKNLLNLTIQELEKAEYASLTCAVSKRTINSEIFEPLEVEGEKSDVIVDYRRFFRSIHNIIRDNEKLDLLACFDEFSKILYLMMADEKYRGEGLERQYFEISRFEGVPDHDPMEMINEWFQAAMKHYYNEVFDEIPKINIGLETLKKVLVKMEKRFRIKDDKLDVKGKAFEEFLPSQLRGKGLGQFFTPRTIVDFMVELANVELDDVILDFACGSGGFLIKSFAKMKQSIAELPDASFAAIKSSKAQVEEQVKNQIFGIDAEPKAVRIAKMNMMLWGDGEKIVRGNGLADVDWKGNEYVLKEYDEHVEQSGCTLILANPPFIKETKREIMAGFALAAGRKSVEAQTLFLEKGLRYLRPSGRMLIVLPEGILSNPQEARTREYIMKNAKIKAILELPKHSFVQSGVDTINTVILYVEKYQLELKRKIEEQLGDGKEPEKNIRLIQNMEFEELDYDIFMGSVQNVGFEPNGRVYAKQDTDLDEMLRILSDPEYKENKIDLVGETLDHLFGQERNAWKKNNCDYMKVGFRHLQTRFDPSYYLFWKNIGHTFDDFVPLSDYHVVMKKEKLEKPAGGEALEKEYKIFGVDKSNAYGVIQFVEYKFGYDISKESAKRLILREGCIVYNPYRANIGSMALVPEGVNGVDEFGEEVIDSLASGAYVQFYVKDFHMGLLLSLLKSPLYNKYISVLSNGTIRDNFSPDSLRSMLVPKLDKKGQEELYKKLQKNQEKILLLRGQTNDLVTDGIRDIYKNIGIL